jgi:plasmid stability protein
VKNITVSVPDEVYRAARITAAERDTSVSALVRDYLRSLTDDGEDEFERLQRRRRELVAGVDPRFDPKDNLPRDALHDRDALREEHIRATRALR